MTHPELKTQAATDHDGEAADQLAFPGPGEFPMTKTILITGSSSGIGRASARLFQQRGWNVVATMRTPDKETELTRLPQVLVTCADVTDDASLAAAIEQGIARFARIDVLLNNAGYGAYGPIEATSVEHMRKEFETNVIGMLSAVRAIAPHFREEGGGTIVNVSSVGGKVAMPLGALYHGSKFAVEGATEALQYEMETINVRVKLVEPGMTKTNFGGSSFQFNDDPSLSEYREIVGKTLSGFGTLNANPGTPESVAQTIYLAATDPSARLRFPTGEDAEAMLKWRSSDDDATFFQRVREMFQLTAKAPR